ncbi:unnamed protein product [Parnassius apollo]|uniref:(apollo) hypothetical protein n=1 Tax=Parnassius apollo TaxID=110799 RepID=A0A8S3YER1_PARAO|nr:unnamed protein product [Parnassius apollo]
MKVLGVCLLAFVVAVQLRHSQINSVIKLIKKCFSHGGVTSENPWVVHLRIAVSTSGYLRTCVGSLIDNRWVLTAASCMENVRFVWIRYGADNVINPELVTETTIARTNGEIAIISINRAVGYTDNINAVALPSIDDEVPATGIVCGYGADEDNNPGEQIICPEIVLEPFEDGNILGISEDVTPTHHDIGAPLVSNGVQIGILSIPIGRSHSAVFVNPAKYRDWIKEQIGVEL